MKQGLSPGLRARRGRERGAAIFIVVLLISMLLGIGLFAARSASLSTATSGHGRQMTQAQYLAEYAILLSWAELNKGPVLPKIISEAKNPALPSPCYGQTDPLLLAPHCVRYCYKAAQDKLAAQGQVPLEELGLGSAQIEADFCVELTDWTPSPFPVAGSATTLKTYSVTATSIAVVRARPKDPASPQDASGYSSSVQMSRAYLTTLAVP